MQERELSQKDEKSFKEYFAKLVEENNVVPALWLMQDEFNEFFFVPCQRQENVDDSPGAQCV